MSRSFETVPKILVVAEGFTEKNYLDHLRKRDMGCSLIVRKSPDTQPAKILRACSRMVRDLGIKLDRGDRAFIVFDWDCFDSDIIRKTVAEAKKRGIGVLFSKPCFEIVFLAHFVRDISLPKDQRDVLEMLEKHIEGYSKTKDYWNELIDKQERARKNLAGLSFDETTDYDSLRNGSNVFELFEVIDNMK